MSKYSTRPKHSSPARNLGKPKKLAVNDIRKLESRSNIDVVRRRQGGVEYHVDKNDGRPHSIHKTVHPKTGKVSFFKKIFKSTRELYQHHLQNKEARARIREENATASREEAEGKANIERAKAERTRARGEATRNVEEGFGRGFRDVEEGAGEGIARAQKQRSRNENINISRYE